MFHLCLFINSTNVTVFVLLEFQDMKQPLPDQATKRGFLQAACLLPIFILFSKTSCIDDQSVWSDEFCGLLAHLSWKYPTKVILGGTEHLEPAVAGQLYLQPVCVCTRLFAHVHTLEIRAE